MLRFIWPLLPLPFPPPLLGPVQPAGSEPNLSKPEWVECLDAALHVAQPVERISRVPDAVFLLHVRDSAAVEAAHRFRFGWTKQCGEVQVSWPHHSLFFRLDQVEVAQEDGRLTLRGLYAASSPSPKPADRRHELSFAGAGGDGLRALGDGLRRLSAARRAHGSVSHFCACVLAPRHPQHAQWCAAPQSWPAVVAASTKRAPVPSRTVD
jgi:hypothetical protein